jgi:hypothetical protein
MSRRSQGLLVAVLWLLSLALLAAVLVVYSTDRLAHSGFPRMPLYGAITWWFFLTIPVIGVTWGFLNDWKGDHR